MPYWISFHPIIFIIIPDTLLISYAILQHPVIWNSFKIWQQIRQQIWHIYTLMRPGFCTKIRGWGISGPKKKDSYFMAKKRIRTRVWKMSLRRAKSTIISWHGLFIKFVLFCIYFYLFIYLFIYLFFFLKTLYLTNGWNVDYKPFACSLFG